MAVLAELWRNSASNDADYAEILGRPLARWPRLRRVVYGVPHRYRFRDTTERRRKMGEFLAAEYATGASIGLISLTAGEVLRSRIAIVMAVVGGYAVAVILLRYAEKFAPGWYHVGLVLGGGLIGSGTFGAGELALAQSAMFILGSGYGFVFFFHWRAGLYLSAAAAYYWLILDELDASAIPQAVWALVVCATSLGYCISTVVGREAGHRLAAEAQQQQIKEEKSREHSELTFLATAPYKLLQMANESLGESDDETIAEARTALFLGRERYKSLLDSYVNRDTEAGLPARVQLRTIVEGCINDLTPFYPDIAFNVDYPEDRTTICIDNVTLSSVLTEVMANAWTHGQGTRSRPAVVLRVSEADRLLTVVVRDHGPGLTATEQDAVFDLTWASAESDPGLGLTRCLWLLQRSGGSISLTRDSDAEASQGISVRVDLPIRSDCDGQDPGVCYAAVVEDNEADRAILKEVISSLDLPRLETAEAISLEGYRELLSKIRPTVLLLDLALQGGDGLILARETRDREIDPNDHETVIVIVSNRPPTAHALNACDAYYRKPLSSDDREDLRSVILKHLRRRNCA